MKIKSRKQRTKESILGVIELENPDNTDLVYRMTMARLRLYVSESATESMLWLIRLFIQDHLDPRPLIDDAISTYGEYSKDLKLVKIAMENELAIKYGEKK